MYDSDSDAEASFRIPASGRGTKDEMFEALLKSAGEDGSTPSSRKSKGATADSPAAKGDRVTKTTTPSVGESENDESVKIDDREALSSAASNTTSPAVGTPRPVRSSRALRQESEPPPKTPPVALRGKRVRRGSLEEEKEDSTVSEKATPRLSRAKRQRKSPSPQFDHEEEQEVVEGNEVVSKRKNRDRKDTSLSSEEEAESNSKAVTREKSPSREKRQRKSPSPQLDHEEEQEEVEASKRPARDLRAGRSRVSHDQETQSAKKTARTDAPVPKTGARLRRAPSDESTKGEEKEADNNLHQPPVKHSASDGESNKLGGRSEAVAEQKRDHQQNYMAANDQSDARNSGEASASCKPNSNNDSDVQDKTSIGINEDNADEDNAGPQELRRSVRQRSTRSSDTRERLENGVKRRPRSSLRGGPRRSAPFRKAAHPKKLSKASSGSSANEDDSSDGETNSPVRKFARNRKGLKDRRVISNDEMAAGYLSSEVGSLRAALKQLVVAVSRNTSMLGDLAAELHHLRDTIRLK